MKKYKRIVVSIATVLVLCFITGFCYAKPVEITEEKLKNVLKEFEKLSEGEDCKFDVSNNKIKVTTDEESYYIDYDLEKEPTFSTKISVRKGMSYQEFKKEAEGLQNPFLGYIAVANIQGTTLEDATTYIVMQAFNSAFSGTTSSNSYVIVDDTDLLEGATINKDPNDTKTIYVSEFENRVMEYVNSIYESKKTIEDKNGANTFTWTIERTNITDTSCDIVSKLTVNLNGDFSKIKESSEDIFGPLDKDKEKSDYKITLKVGQSLKIETNETITGYHKNGNSVTFKENSYNEIVATKKGETKVWLNIGNNQKSIYITVEENTNNEKLEPVVLKIDQNSNVSNTNKSTTNEKNNKLSTLKGVPYLGTETNFLLIELYIIIIVATISVLLLLTIEKKNK